MRSFILFTNRNGIVFDDAGTQDVTAQLEVSCYHVGTRAQEVIDSCDEFHIAQWGEWDHVVPKRSIEYLLGLRTRERDLEENEGGRGHA